MEDLATVLALVLLPALAGLLGGRVDPHGAAAPESGLALAFVLVITLGKVAAFVVLALLLGPRLVPWVLKQVSTHRLARTVHARRPRRGARHRLRLGRNIRRFVRARSILRRRRSE